MSETTTPNTPDSGISNDPNTGGAVQNNAPTPQMTQPNTPPAPISTPPITEESLNKAAETMREQTTPPAEPVVQGIAQRLANQAPAPTPEETAKPTANTPMMIDLANLSTEQLSMLKSMLSVTPDKVQQKRGNIIIQIRKTVVNDEDRYIIDFKRSRLALDYHAETGKEYETHVLPVLLDGEAEYKDMNYTEFMQSDRVNVEVLSQRSKETITEEGQVLQRATGKLVNKEVKTMEYWYTVKLPNGEVVELQGKMANA